MTNPTTVYMYEYRVTHLDRYGVQTFALIVAPRSDVAERIARERGILPIAVGVSCAVGYVEA